MPLPLPTSVLLSMRWKITRIYFGLLKTPIEKKIEIAHNFIFINFIKFLIDPLKSFQCFKKFEDTYFCFFKIMHNLISYFFVI